MNSDLLNEQQLRQALQPLLHSSTPPPLGQIKGRAQAKRRRRTRLVSGSVSAGVACAALVAAGPLHLIGYGPGAASDAPICTPTELMAYAFGTVRIAPQDLPDSMRLGWAADDLPPMQWGGAARLVHNCAHAPVHRLIDVEDGVVVRTVNLNATPLTTSPGDTNLAQDPPAATPLNGHSIYYDAQDPTQAEFRRQGTFIVAGWNSDGYQYEIAAEGLDQSDMQDLVNNVRTNGATINASQWQPSADFEFQGATQVPPDSTDFSWTVYSDTPDGDAQRVSLKVEETNDNFMLWANAGDTVTTVGGHPALQSQDGTVTWSPNDHAVAFVDGSLSHAQLMDAATTVTTMGSDALPPQWKP